MNNLLNKNEALEAALEQAGLKAEYVRLISCRLDGVCYELELRSDWMWYDCFIGATTGNMIGFNSEPSVDVDAIDGVYCSELLSGETVAEVA